MYGITSIFNKTMDHMFPKISRQQMKNHGCKINMVDANDNKNDR